MSKTIHVLKKVCFAWNNLEQQHLVQTIGKAYLKDFSTLLLFFFYILIVCLQQILGREPWLGLANIKSTISSGLIGSARLENIARRFILSKSKSKFLEMNNNIIFGEY